MTPAPCRQGALVIAPHAPCLSGLAGDVEGPGVHIAPVAGGIAPVVIQIRAEDGKSPAPRSPPGTSWIAARWFSAVGLLNSKKCLDSAVSLKKIQKRCLAPERKPPGQSRLQGWTCPLPCNRASGLDLVGERERCN